MRTILLAAALASGAFGTTVFAQQATPPAPAAAPAPPPPPGGMMRGGGAMRMADANRDGIVTKEEALAAADARFARLDTDRDGKLTAAEMQAAMDRMRAARGGEDAGPPPPPGGPKHAPGMGRAADPDRDGVITQAESRARAGARFDRMDTNHDGKLDAGELAAGRGPGRRMPGGPDAPPPPTADDQ